MKKIIIAALAIMSLGGLQAQTILDEGFETGNTGNAPQPVASGSGWTVINGYTGTNTSYNWHNYYAEVKEETGGTITGPCCASVDAPFTATGNDGLGPREEILLTPELDLNDTYQLKFTFRVSPVNATDVSRYDLQVRVVTGDDLTGAETIFSIQNEKMLREAGIVDFPIDTWSPFTASIDLSEFKGEKVKLAFVYKMLTKTANVVWLDDVSVSKFTPATGPVAALNTERYAFPQMYIGEKMYSEVVTLRNTGKDGLTVTGVDCPAGFSLNTDLSDVNLDRNKSISFQVVYNAQLASATQGDIVLHTNGGDVKLAVTASKQFVPEGMTLETFESYNPPAGWVNNGWSWTNQAFEGDHSMNCSGGFGACTLRSPRIDLSDGGKITFTYYNYFESENETDAPQYDITLQVSNDGGDNWVTKWTSDYQNGLNQMLTATVDLGYGSDQAYVRWFYPAVESDDEGAYPHSSFTLDRVLLPTLFGAGGAPLAAKIVSPANNAQDIYPRDIVLEWSPAQFAEGYKVYVGTNTACDDLVNGEDVGTALSYTLAKCEYATTYRWKVVPYNSEGNASGVSTWRFTTQPDVTVSEFPYVQDFLEDGTPAGWTQTPSATYNRTWNLNSIYPYIVDGKSYGAYSTTWLNAGEWNAVATQEFNLPADANICITFAWGDDHPSSLVVDPTGLVKKQNVEPNNGNSQLSFDIFVDNEWKTLSTLSENTFDGNRKYWINEKIDLSAFKGKKVQFRWRHNSYSSRDNGGAIAHIVLYENVASKGEFNVASWNAGKVNFNKGADSHNTLTLLNKGSETLKVANVSFATPNFSSTLKAGDEIAVEDGLPFTVEFSALNKPGNIEDVMTVEFEGGYKMEFPVAGEALPEGTYYYSFEPNDKDYVWDQDFTMIDVDKGVNFSFSSYWVHYSADGQRGAFSCESDSKEDGMYGMMKPVSGTYALVASSPQSSAADNWIISKRMKATSNSSFEFYARNWESINSVLPAPKHSVTVLVSTEGNTNTSDFTPVMDKTEMPFLADGEWNHYTVDLKDYAGKDVYVAVQHTTTSASNLAFFDDFRFNNFDIKDSGVDNIAADIDDNSMVEVYSIGGVLVARGYGMQTLSDLARGFYVVRVSNGTSTRAYKLAR